MRFRKINVREYYRGNQEKLAISGTQDEEKQNKHRTQLC
jgi:hypothetical protein